MFKNKYGCFSGDGKEYIITDPRTPRPWFNYIWNEHYAGLVSHTGGGFSFLESPRDNRLTRMRYNSLPWDRPGRYVIVKDSETGKFWSLSWAPTIDKVYKKYECRHGQGYTKITTEINNIRGEITYFVPPDLNAEIWRVKLTNLSSRKRKLEIYSFTELLMGNALNDLINQPNDKHFTEVVFDKQYRTLSATRRYWVLNKKVSVAQPNIDWKYRLLFTQTLPISGFDSSLDNFIGKWRSESNPESIETGRMKNTEITSGDAVAALQSKITLKPKDSKDFAVIMAAASKENENPYDELRWNELTDISFIDKLYGSLMLRWDKTLSHIKADTPDKDFNLMINVWNQYQAAVTFDMARNSGYYHGGLLFGNGMRDQFQDILGVVITNPDLVRKRLLNALKFQFSDGSTLHNFFKLTDWGERTNHSDTPLWIPLGIIEYLNETGDLTILDEVVSFYDGGSAAVYTHMQKAIDFALSATTERGIPKIMNGDWNDTLDHVGPLGKGETVWGGFFLGYILKKTVDLLTAIPIVTIPNVPDDINRWKNAYHNLREVLNKYAWDGDWYLRAFRDNGEPLGSKKHKQGKIFINSQTWSVISGLAPKERADKALASADKMLKRRNGMQICFPSYTEVEDNVGLISRCVPGKKENGAIFNHASSWFVLASIINGDAETAYNVYRSMLPVNSSKRIDRYEAEPYVFAEYVTSPDHNSEGQASHSWLTGTAVWMLRIAVDYILGFRTSFEGITISPNIPARWNSFKAERKFRGKLLKVEVINNGKTNALPDKIIVNGEEKDNLIKVSDYKEDVLNIIVRL